jgi:hypothetical protein
MMRAAYKSGIGPHLRAPTIHRLRSIGAFMSNPDTFIDEVTEELRRDRLYGMARKYGWIGVLLVVLVVGGAAWREYSNAKATATAQAFGDGLIDALDLGDEAARRAALSDLSAAGGQSAIKALVLAADSAQDPAAALAALASVENDATLPQLYRDLASLRRVMLAGASLPLPERRSALEAISGRGFGLLAREQLAYLLLEEGNTDAAIEALGALLQDQAAPSGLRARAEQAITALGGEVPQLITPQDILPQNSAG